MSLFRFSFIPGDPEKGTVQGKHLDNVHKDLSQERWGIHDGDPDPDYISDLLVPDDWLGHFYCNYTL